MTLGERIKKLRRDADMTQEGLAEYLGVSVSAVSQWENGRIMPDITQIPVLANMFDVTTDYLLGVDVESKEKQIDEIVEKANELSMNAHFKEADALLLDGLKKFPNSFKLMDGHLSGLFYQYHEVSGEERAALYREITALGEKIVAECPDSRIRYSVIHTLLLIYPKENEYDKARELTKELPFYLMSKPFVFEHITKGNELLSAKMQIVSRLVSELSTRLPCMNVTLDNGETAYTPEEMLALNQKVLDLLDIFFENGDYGFYHTRLRDCHATIAAISCDLGRTAEAVEHLQKAADAAILFDTAFREDTPHTSLLFRDTPDGSVHYGSTDNDSAELLNTIRSDRFAKIHNTPEYNEVIRRLTETAGKR